LIEKSAKKTVIFVDFKVEGTVFLDGSKLIGWRITATDQTNNHENEYWVHHGQICLVDFRTSKPWTHKTPFIVARPVTRIRAAERQAILLAIARW
jgi:hypothetical protein